MRRENRVPWVWPALLVADLVLGTWASSYGFWSGAWVYGCGLLLILLGGVAVVYDRPRRARLRAPAVPAPPKPVPQPNPCRHPGSQVVLGLLGNKVAEWCAACETTIYWHEWLARGDMTPWEPPVPKPTGLLQGFSAQALDDEIARLFGIPEPDIRKCDGCSG